MVFNFSATLGNSWPCDIQEIIMSIDTYERELIIESLEYRLENDDRLIRDFGTKEDLTYLLERLSDEYL